MQKILVNIEPVDEAGALKTLEAVYLLTKELNAAENITINKNVYLTVNEYAMDLEISPETFSLFRQLEVVKNYIAQNNLSMASDISSGVPFIDILRQFCESAALALNTTDEFTMLKYATRLRGRFKNVLTLVNAKDEQMTGE